MAGKAFVDTNVLLRSLIDQFPESDVCKTLIIAQRRADVELWISRQVLREQLVQFTHPRTLTTPLTTEQTQAQVEALLSLFWVADETFVTTTLLFALIRDYEVRGKQVHDANIVASMLANGIDTLLTPNTADFKRYQDKITLVVPGAENTASDETESD